MLNLILAVWSVGWTIFLWNSPDHAFACGANFVLALWCLTDVMRDLA
jgi:hypothetical protein